MVLVFLFRHAAVHFTGRPPCSTQPVVRGRASSLFTLSSQPGGSKTDLVFIQVWATWYHNSHQVILNISSPAGCCTAATMMHRGLSPCWPNPAVTTWSRRTSSPYCRLMSYEWINQMSSWSITQSLCFLLYLPQTCLFLVCVCLVRTSWIHILGSHFWRMHLNSIPAI